MTLYRRSRPPYWIGEQPQGCRQPCCCPERSKTKSGLRSCGQSWKRREGGLSFCPAPDFGPHPRPKSMKPEEIANCKMQIANLKSFGKTFCNLQFPEPPCAGPWSSFTILVPSSLTNRNRGRADHGNPDFSRRTVDCLQDNRTVLRQRAAVGRHHHFHFVTNPP